MEGLSSGVVPCSVFLGAGGEWKWVQPQGRSWLIVPKTLASSETPRPLNVSSASQSEGGEMCRRQTC